jgi:hypothetical protein
MIGRLILCKEVILMVICPVAIAVGCKKCPIFKVCPATRIIGDQPPIEEESKSKPASASRKPAKPSKSAKPVKRSKAKRR